MDLHNHPILAHDYVEAYYIFRWTDYLYCADAIRQTSSCNDNHYMSSRNIRFAYQNHFP